MRLIFLFLVSTTLSFGQTIPLSRIVDWSNAGYPDSFPNPPLVLDVTNFGAVGDSIFDNTTAIRNAIDSLHGGRGVIYFPPGNYIIGSTIDLADSVILRGASSDSTRLILNLQGAVGNGFKVTGSASGLFTAVRSGSERGSNAIVVNNPSSFTAGDFCELVQDNGAWDSQPVSWANNSVGQILHLTGNSGDTLFFDSALRLNYDTSLNLRIQKITPAREIGIECLQISRADSVHVGVCINIYFNYAANCWIKGVESSKSIGSHIEMDASTNITITGSYVHHNFEYDGTSTHGYGITFFAHTGQCLVTNNIMRHLRHSFSFQTGANGNVLSYNYSIDPNRSEVPSNLGADISMHGHYPYANLFEGNIVQNIQIDQTWGPSGPFNTFFRNKAELYGILMTSGTVQSDSLNFVGNEVPNTGFLLGNYTLAGGAHFEYGNNIRGTITPPGTTVLTDTSYYLSGPPAFWITLPFPSIGYPNALNTGSIPARDRYLAGANLTICEETIFNSINFPFEKHISIYPNPSAGIIAINGLTSSGNALIELKDLNGRTLLSKTISILNGEVNLEFPAALKNGIYLMSVTSGENIFVRKIVLLK